MTDQQCVLPSPDRSGCAGTRHGTVSAYMKAHCRCPDAREACRLYHKRRREGRAEPRLVPVLGAARRLRALGAIGWSHTALAERLGWWAPQIQTTRRSAYPTITARRAQEVRDVYDALCMTRGPSNRTAIYARRHGWAPPFAWDDETIDDPDGKPDFGEQSMSTVDHEVVRRILAGALLGNGKGSLKPTRADQLAVACALLERNDVTPNLIQATLATGMSVVWSLLADRAQPDVVLRELAQRELDELMEQRRQSGARRRADPVKLEKIRASKRRHQRNKRQETRPVEAAA